MAYLHLGRDIVVSTGDIIGIFDLDTSTFALPSRNFFKQAEQQGCVTAVSNELPKSAVVCKSGGRTVVYISQISSRTLLRRSGARRT